MTLDEVRVNIDRVDSQIKELFRERMELAEQVARVKAVTGDVIYKPDREVAMIDRLAGDMDERIRLEYEALLKRMIQVSRKYQYGRTLEMRDCFDIEWQTEEEEYKKPVMIKSELYICDMVSKDIVVTVDNYAQVGEMIRSGKADAGIGILENVGVSPEEAIHSILVNDGLYINQCRIVLDVDVRKKVVLFSDKLVVKPEHNRLKFVFACPNESGALSRLLSAISDFGVNLTEIHSRPRQIDGEWNYDFYAELDGNLLDKDIQAMVFQLECETAYFKILGSYYCTGDF